MPGLTLPALKEAIDKKRLGPIHVFVGEDVKLVDRMVDAVEATIDPADRPFAVDRLYAGDEGGSPVDIVASARSLPMLGDRRLVIVLRAERLLKPKRASKAAAEDGEGEAETEDAMDTAAIEDYVAAPAASTTLVFVATEIDRTRRLTKRVLDKALVTEFAGLAVEGGGPGARRDAGVSAAKWLQDELVRVGRTIESDAARLLVTRAAGEITKLRGDIERLLLFIGTRPRITSDDVMEVVAAHATVDDEWAVVNAISEGNVARALVEAGKRLERGDSVHALVGQLRWWVSSRLAEGDSGRVRPALEALLRTDLALKSSGGDERILIERLVIELTGKPVASRGWRG